MSVSIVLQDMVALYIRVSTDGQSIAMQLSAAAQYISDIEPSRLVQLIDDGVSATKVKRQDRKNLRVLEDLIRSGRISTLIVYDRSRLARNFYEYVDIARMLIEYNVNVVFAGTNVRPFDKSLTIEAIYAIFAELEGKEIGRRTADARNQFPTNILGYNRHIDVQNSRKVWYTIDETVAPQIRDLFNETLRIRLPEDLFSIITKYKRVLKRNEVRVLAILKNAFFAGCWYREGEYIELPHSEAIVNLDTFMQVQEKLSPFFPLIHYIGTSPQSPIPVQVICDRCGAEMKYTQDILSGVGHYRCTKKHTKNEVLDVELASRVQEIMQQQIQRLDLVHLKLDCNNEIHAQLKEARLGMAYVTSQLEQISIKIALEARSSTVPDDLKQMREYEKRLLELDSTIRYLLDCKGDLEAIVDMVKSHVQQELTDDANLTEFMRQFVTKIGVGAENVDIYLSMGGYFSKEVDCCGA